MSFRIACFELLKSVTKMLFSSATFRRQLLASWIRRVLQWILMYTLKLLLTNLNFSCKLRKLLLVLLWNHQCIACKYQYNDAPCDLDIGFHTLSMNRIISLHRHSPSDTGWVMVFILFRFLLVSRLQFVTAFDFLLRRIAYGHHTPFHPFFHNVFFKEVDHWRDLIDFF